jgi:hypothetical protein
LKRSRLGKGRERGTSKKVIGIPPFFAKANQKRRKKYISCLTDGENELNEEDMRRHAMNFYQNLFRKEHRQNIKLNRGFWQEDEKVGVEENLNLEVDFLEEVIKKVIDDSYSE